MAVKGKGKTGMLVGGIALAVAVAGGILLANYIQSAMNKPATNTEA